MRPMCGRSCMHLIPRLDPITGIGHLQAAKGPGEVLNGCIERSLMGTAIIWLHLIIFLSFPYSYSVIITFTYAHRKTYKTLQKKYKNITTQKNITPLYIIIYYSLFIFILGCIAYGMPWVALSLQRGGEITGMSLADLLRSRLQGIPSPYILVVS